MEMLLYQSTQFRDVKKILDRAHGFAGLLTAGGIEASRLDVPFVCDQKVLSRYDDACADIRRILTMQLGLELPKGFSIPLEAEDLAVFFSQQCGLQQMQDYLTQKRARTQADIQTWLRDRPWDTHPVTAAQAAAQTAGNIIMPLCGAFSAFGVSASLSPELKLIKLADMIKKLTIGVLSFVAAAFSAVLGLKSLLAGSADTLASKGIKLALSSAVPIVGGALSDAYSSIIGSVSLLKSTVGVFGVIAVVMIDLPVVLQLTARIILLKLLGVLSSSMGDDTTGKVLDTLSSALTVINAAVIFTAVLFIISTGIVISVKAGA